jgi:hypothetical protein
MRQFRLLTVLVIAISLFSCSGQESDFPQVDGWSRAGEVMVYDTDNLWEYINGAAELFVEYDVQTCHAADLSSGDLTVTVDLYDMGTPLNAFGVYNRESSGAGAPFPNAVEAVVSPPYQALLLKGATYVKVNAIEGELTATTGRELLDAVARALPGQTDYPSELRLLPANGKVTGSEGYQSLGFLGLTELTHCLYAEYTGDGAETWQGFVMLAAAGTSPTSAWDRLAGEWDSLEHRDLQVLYKEIPYVGLVGVVQTEAGTLGASGAADRTELLSRLDGLIP